jgi:hypothetical protein
MQRILQTRFQIPQRDKKHWKISPASRRRMRLPAYPNSLPAETVKKKTAPAMR